MTENLISILGDQYIIFQPDPAHMLVLFDFFLVEIFSVFAFQSFLYDEINEVTAGLYSYHHSFLHYSSGSQTLQTCKSASLWAFSVTAHIMSLQTQKMTQAMGEKNCADSLFNKFLHWEFVNNSNLNQMLIYYSLCE